MSCLSLVKLNRSCKGTVGGVKKLFAVAFKDIVSYSFDSNKVINTVTFTSGNGFVEIGTIKNSVSFSESLNKDKSKGISFFKNTANISVSEISKDSQTFIKSILYQPVVIVFQTKMGSFHILGLDGFLTLATLDGGTGTSYDDLNGYQLGFEGFSNLLSHFINPAIVIPIPEIPTEDFPVFYELSNVAIGTTEAIFQFS